MYWLLHLNRTCGIVTVVLCMISNLKKDLRHRATESFVCGVDHDHVISSGLVAS